MEALDQKQAALDAGIKDLADSAAGVDAAASAVATKYAELKASAGNSVSDQELAALDASLAAVGGVKSSLDSSKAKLEALLA